MDGGVDYPIYAALPTVRVLVVKVSEVLVPKLKRRQNSGLAEQQERAESAPSLATP
jgi:hypothetical protein